MTTRYVSNSGSGTTYSIGSPGAPSGGSGAIGASSGDDIILALDGTYTGADYMLDMSSISGTSGHPITFQAVNDGGVFINGEDARHPVNLNGSSWWVIEGINAGNLDSGSTDGVYTLDASSKHNILRRCIGWNSGASTNTQVFQCDNSSDFNLFEDLAAFGTGRKMFSVFLSLNNTFRRCWGQFSGNTSIIGPQQVYTNYSSYNTIFENCIGTWDEGSLGIGVDVPFGIFGAFQMTGASGIPGGAGTIQATCIYNGCIAYQLSTQTGFFNEGAVFGGPFVDGVTFNNCASYLQNTGGDASPTCHLYNLQVVGEFGNSIPAIAHNLTNFSGINAESAKVPIPTSPTGADSWAEADWSQSNVKTGLTVTSIYGGQSLWINDGTKGATITNRLESGVDTGIPLFPWPMNQRIIDAMTLEGSLTVRNVNTDIYTIFGTPPTVAPGSDPPVDDFDSYMSGADLAGNNGGTGDWLTAWTTDGGTAMTLQPAPAGGQGGLAVRSIGAGDSYHYRTFSNVRTGTFRWEMSSSVTNPNDDLIGVSMHETGVSIRTQVQFSSGGNIRAYDYDGAAWVNVLVGFSASTLYRIELEIDGTLQPDLYRVRVNEGTWTAWIGASGPMTVLNHIQINNFSTNSTLYLDAIGATFTPPAGIPIDDFDSYTAGTNLNGLNGGMRWGGAWTKVTGTINVATAPAGMIGNAIKSS